MRRIREIFFAFLGIFFLPVHVQKLSPTSLARSNSKIRGLYLVVRR